MKIYITCNNISTEGLTNLSCYFGELSNKWNGSNIHYTLEKHISHHFHGCATFVSSSLTFCFPSIICSAQVITSNGIDCTVLYLLLVHKVWPKSINTKAKPPIFSSPVLKPLRYKTYVIHHEKFCHLCRTCRIV